MNTKKILALILSGIMLLTAFVSCGDNKDPSADTEASATAAPVDNTPEYTYKSVVIIGVDGMGAFGKNTDTPNMDRIFAEGASTYGARTAFPSISGQCWGSLMIGSSAYVHGITNTIAQSSSYENEALPTIFKRVRAAMPDAVLASYCEWEPINIGIVEQDIGVNFASDKDVKLHSDVADYLKDNDPTLMFVHFDSPDASGHSNGYGSENHLERVTAVDKYIGRIYDSLKDIGKLEDTLFIVTTDHGGTPDAPGSHGGYTDAEMDIFFGAVGKTIKKGSTIGEMNIRDVAAVVLRALGLEIPEFNIDGFSAQIPDGLFTDYTAPERKPIEVLESTFTTFETPSADSGKYITNFISEDKISAVLHFDDSTKAAVGSPAITEIGTPKYYSTGYFGSCIELGQQGHISVKNAIPEKDSFSVSLWFEHNRATAENTVLFASHDLCNSHEQGFSVAYNGACISVNIGNGKSSQYYEYSLSEMMPDGWMNLTIVFNKGKGELTAYINFGDPKTDTMSTKFASQNIGNSEFFTVGNDYVSEGTVNYNSSNIMLDELLVFNCALDAEDVKKLAEYYSVK